VSGRRGIGKSNRGRGVNTIKVHYIHIWEYHNEAMKGRKGGRQGGRQGGREEGRKEKGRKEVIFTLAFLLGFYYHEAGSIDFKNE
jgi:hypothetical protein